MGQREQERQRGKRRENRHEKRQALHSGGGEWDCLRLPEGVEVFKPEKDETYHIDIIPYIVGAHNKNADKGDEYFELSYPVYRNLGVDEKKYVAIGEMKGMKDPVAEHFAKLRKEGADWDDMKMFKPTWRQLMLVFVHEQADKGLQLFEGAYGTFGELIDEEIKANGESEAYIDNFDDPDGGATLKVRFKAKSIGQTNPWVLASKIEFVERENGFNAADDKKLAAEVLAKAAGVCLDDLLKIPDYDTLKKALDGEPMTEDEEDDAPPAKTTGKRPTPARADEDEEPADEKPSKKKADDEDEDDAAEVAKAMKAEKAKIAAKNAAKEEEEEEAAEAATPPKKTMAEKLGIVKGGEVTHDEHGECTVIKILEDGETCNIMDADDNVHKGIDVTDLEPKGEAKPTAGAKGKTEAGSSKAGAASGAGTKGAQKEASASPSDKKKGDDDNWDEDWDDGDKKKKK